MKALPTLSVAAVLGCSLAACGSRPPSTPELDAASQAVQTAAADPTVANGAPTELNRARDALQTAETAWKNNGNESETASLAYIAKQRAAIATTVAQQRQSEQRFAQVSAERDQVVLQARTAEAEAARRQAEKAQAQASAQQQQLAAAEQKNTQLQQELKGLSAKQSNRGAIVTLGDVVFNTGQATLKPGAMRTIDRLADMMRQNPERKVLVEGFTDSQGSEELNMALSQRRADAVKQALVERGTDADRILTRGYGPGYPVGPNDTPYGRQMNRRVEIVVSDAQGNVRSR